MKSMAKNCVTYIVCSIFVIHNLKDTSTLAEYKIIWGDLCQLYDGHEENFVLPATGKAVKFYQSPKNHSRHICLLDDTSEFGRLHNDDVFELLRVMIDLVVPNTDIKEEDAIGLTPILQVFKSLLPRYISNIKDVEFKNGVIIATPALDENGKAKTPYVIGIDDSKIVDTNLDKFEPAYKCFGSPTEYRIILEIPCVDLQNPATIKCIPGKSTRMDNFAVKIFGTKSPLDLGSKEIIVLPTPGEVSDVKPEQQDFCKYGSWSRDFHIPNSYQKMIPTPSRIAEGVIQYSFPISSDWSSE